MTRIVIIKNQSGDIIDSRGQNIGPLVDRNPVIKIRTDDNHNILGVNSHITLVTDAPQIGSSETLDIDGGIF